MSSPEQDPVYEVMKNQSGRKADNHTVQNLTYENVGIKETSKDKETIIEHDSMNEIQITSCDPEKCHERHIRYNVTMEQIVALIQRSSECRQYIKYRCIGSILFEGGGYTQSATWLSRDGSHMKYWEGATSRRNFYCACGETESCVDSNKKCNCDSNSRDTETSDEGFLTDKDTLPVTGLQFGDAGDAGEYGWHTLGPLVCTGRN
ncbi:unnamed protein product [Clavelina lepadiformis]|uniref:Uncharacterized protein n=1 Tax=Clavelina lepadiformis TaxID=159417 RepID=A0ABP0GVE8_CLALP